MWFTSVLLLVALAHALAAQVPGLTSPSAPAPSEQEERAEDPLGRATPRGTITAFMRAADREDFVAASRYMQVTASQRRSTPTLARDLKRLMDRFFSESIRSIRDEPDGALDDGLPIDRERIGPLTIGDREVDVTLVRVPDPTSGQIWLISSETLAQLPQLRASIPRTWIEREMPPALVRRELLGISLAHWVVLAASLVVPFVLLALLSGLVHFLGERMLGRRALSDDRQSSYAELRWPSVTVLALFIHLTSIRLIGFPLTFRIVHVRVTLVMAVIALTWLARRLLSLGFARARGIAWGKDRTSKQSLMLLAERALNVLVIVVAVVTILTIAGVNTRTALAGVGIGGIAIALGAQKTVENLLGGVFLLTDRALAVGDLCCISNRLGWVEDITLRSVRIRTLERTLVSVPAGVLAQAGIENFSTREKILVQTTLRLRHGTSVEQLRQILDGVRRLLAEHPRLETGQSRISLVDFGERAVELELFAYVQTADLSDFLEVREELLLDVATIVEASGSGFAQPSPFEYLDGAPASDVPGRVASGGDDGGTRGGPRAAPALGPVRR